MANDQTQLSRRTPLTFRRIILGLGPMVVAVIPAAPLHAQAVQAVAKPPSYAGRILTPDGKPATGAEVILLDLTHPGDRQQIAATRADDDGTFAFHDVQSPTQAPRLTFVARAPGLAPTASSVFPGADAENEFALSPASTVRVTFLDPDGEPVPNLRVTPTMAIARGAGGPSIVYFPPELAARFARQTDAAGACTFEDMPRRSGLRLEVDDPRFARLSYRDDPQIADDAATPPVTVKFLRGGSISGIVRYGPMGRPAAGVQVVAQSLNRNLGGSGWGRAVSSERGEYRMQQVPVGEYNVAVNFNDDRERPWAAAALEGVHLGDGEHLAGQDLTLVTGGLITGHIVRADTAQAVVGVSVGLHGPDHPKSGAMIGGVITDADGAYAFRVAPGAQYLYLSGLPPDGYARPLAEEMTVVEGQTVTVDLKLPRRPGKPVAGRVVAPDGKPVVAAHVIVEVKGDRFGDVASQTTDQTGAFHFAAVTPGTRIRAVRGSMSTVRAAIVDGGEQDIILNLSKRIPRTISGLVTDADSKPINGARVQVITRQGNYGMTMGKPELTDADGRYNVNGLSPDGEYSLNAEADDYAQGSTAVMLGPDREATQAQPLKFERLTARIGGRVVDAGGKPVAGVRVEINGSRNGNRSTITDADGRFAFKVLEGSVPLIFLRDLEGKPRSSQGVRAGDENIQLTETPPKAR